MRIFLLIVLALIGPASCNPVDTHDDAFILFKTRPVQSPSLLAKPVLKCLPGEQRLELDINLKNLETEKIEILEVALSNPAGSKSLPLNTEGSPSKLNGGEETNLHLTFTPVNDKLLFQSTGLRGLIDSTYNLSVFYSVEGKEGTRVVNLVSRMPEETFLTYKETYDTPVQIYYLNTTNGFDERQGQFLQTNLSAKAVPFVHITEQEVALAGLNFRIKCFQWKDSLHAELFVVNHSDMTVKINSSKLGLMVGGVPARDLHLTNEKATGSRDDINVLRKGDRNILTVKAFSPHPPEYLSFSLSEAFVLANGKPLFKENLELIRASGPR